jgi:hypothetical protein
VNKNNDPAGRQNTVNSELAAIDDLEINALTDDELNAVAGGLFDKNKNTTTVASCMCCGATCTSPPSSAMPQTV